MKINNALKSLADIALRAPETDILAVCDAVALLAEGLSLHPPVGPFAAEWRAAQVLGETAAATARAIRDADLRQIHFRDSLRREPPTVSIFDANAAAKTLPTHLPSSAHAPLSTFTSIDQ